MSQSDEVGAVDGFVPQKMKTQTKWKFGVSPYSCWLIWQIESVCVCVCSSCVPLL